jgi:hypothetical protein
MAGYRLARVPAAAMRLETQVNKIVQAERVMMLVCACLRMSPAMVAPDGGRRGGGWGEAPSWRARSSRAAHESQQTASGGHHPRTSLDSYVLCAYPASASSLHAHTRHTHTTTSPSRCAHSDGRARPARRGCSSGTPWPWRAQQLYYGACQPCMFSVLTTCGTHDIGGGIFGLVGVDMASQIMSSSAPCIGKPAIRRGRRRA